MKIDAFTHIFPKAYGERMLRALPDGRDMHKRERKSHYEGNLRRLCHGRPGSH